MRDWRRSVLKDMMADGFEHVLAEMASITKEFGEQHNSHPAAVHFFSRATGILENAAQQATQLQANTLIATDYNGQPDMTHSRMG